MDDVLVILPNQYCENNKLNELNNVRRDIQFTVEMEKENTIPFFDTLIHRKEDTVKFSVYRKPTNKDELIH